MNKIVDALQEAWSLGKDLAPLAAKLWAIYQPGAPALTPATFDEMRAVEQSLTNRLDAPMPEEEA